MRNKVWKKSILIMVSLFLVMSFVNIVGAAGVYSDNDSAITSKVHNKLQRDSQLMGSKINVETIDGEVTLKGSVNSNADINRAAELAYGVEGVKKVDNRLKREQASSSSSSNYGGSSRAPNCPVGANWSC
jgi:Flp pilus assembly secretin CpaC